MAPSATGPGAAAAAAACEYVAAGATAAAAAAAPAVDNAAGVDSRPAAGGSKVVGVAAALMLEEEEDEAPLLWNVSENAPAAAPQVDAGDAATADASVSFPRATSPLVEEEHFLRRRLPSAAAAVTDPGSPTSSRPPALAASVAASSAAAAPSDSASSANASPAAFPVPVTIICGFLGAGKTSMLRALLRLDTTAAAASSVSLTVREPCFNTAAASAAACDGATTSAVAAVPPAAPFAAAGEPVQEEFFDLPHPSQLLVIQNEFSSEAGVEVPLLLPSVAAAAAEGKDALLPLSRRVGLDPDAAFSSPSVAPPAAAVTSAAAALKVETAAAAAAVDRDGPTGVSPTAAVAGDSARVVSAAAVGLRRQNVAAAAASGVGSAAGVVYELPSGCICCSIKGELVQTVEQLLQAYPPGRFAAVLIETSGAADPQQLLRMFWLDEALQDKLRLDAFVTLVDPTSLPMAALDSRSTAASGGAAAAAATKRAEAAEAAAAPAFEAAAAAPTEAAGTTGAAPTAATEAGAGESEPTSAANGLQTAPSEGGERIGGGGAAAELAEAARVGKKRRRRRVEDIWTQQVLCADKIVLTKMDICSGEQLQQAVEKIRAVNPCAQLLQWSTHRSVLPLARQLLHARAYSAGAAASQMLHLQQQQQELQPCPPQQEEQQQRSEEGPPARLSAVGEPLLLPPCVTLKQPCTAAEAEEGIRSLLLCFWFRCPADWLRLGSTGSSAPTALQSLTQQQQQQETPGGLSKLAAIANDGMHAPQAVAAPTEGVTVQRTWDAATEKGSNNNNRTEEAQEDEGRGSGREGKQTLQQRCGKGQQQMSTASELGRSYVVTSSRAGSSRGSHSSSRSSDNSCTGGCDSRVSTRHSDSGSSENRSGSGDSGSCSSGDSSSSGGSSAARRVCIKQRLFSITKVEQWLSELLAEGEDTRAEEEEETEAKQAEARSSFEVQQQQQQQRREEQQQDEHDRGEKVSVADKGEFGESVERRQVYRCKGLFVAWSDTRYPSPTSSCTNSDSSNSSSNSSGRSSSNSSCLDGSRGGGYREDGAPARGEVVGSSSSESVATGEGLSTDFGCCCCSSRWGVYELQGVGETFEINAADPRCLIAMAQQQQQKKRQTEGAVTNSRAAGAAANENRVVHCDRTDCEATCSCDGHSSVNTIGSSSGRCSGSSISSSSRGSTSDKALDEVNDERSCHDVCFSSSSGSSRNTGDRYCSRTDSSSCSSSSTTPCSNCSSRACSTSEREGRGLCSPRVLNGSGVAAAAAVPMTDVLSRFLFVAEGLEKKHVYEDLLTHCTEERELWLCSSCCSCHA